MRAFTRRAAALALPAFCAILTALPCPSAHGQSDGSLDPEPPFVICEDQRYALCAASQCFVYNQVAYCKCDIEKGDSISLQLTYDTPTGEKDVCDLNQEGRFSGYMVSTYSFPTEALKGGKGAVYTCPGIVNKGDGVPAPVAYGQCDGGLCFTSTIGRSFPGFPGRLQINEIMCSCPISTKEPGSEDPLGYQIFGPYRPDAPPGERCDPRACDLCSVANPKGNGSTLPVGAPTGVATFLTVALDGPPAPETNHCACRCTKGSDDSVSCTLAGEGS